MKVNINILSILTFIGVITACHCFVFHFRRKDMPSHVKLRDAVRNPRFDGFSGCDILKEFGGLNFDNVQLSEVHKQFNTPLFQEGENELLSIYNEIKSKKKEFLEISELLKWKDLLQIVNEKYLTKGEVFQQLHQIGIDPSNLSEIISFEKFDKFVTTLAKTLQKYSITREELLEAKYPAPLEMHVTQEELTALKSVGIIDKGPMKLLQDNVEGDDYEDDYEVDE